MAGSKTFRALVSLRHDIVLMALVVLISGQAALAQYRQAEPTEGLSQADLDAFAKSIHLGYAVVENTYHNEKLYQAEVTLTNNGSVTFPSSGWEIIFSQPNLVEPESYPYPNGVEKPKYGVRIFFLVGNVYRVVPTASFGTIRPGASKVFRFISENADISLTDTHPNWYFVGPGLSARVIESTRGNSLDFVALNDRPATWKRFMVKGGSDYDIYNPFTAADRYDKFKVDDLHQAPNIIVPTPAVVEVYNRRSTLNVRSESWVIVTSPRLANEGHYLGEIWNIPLDVRVPANHYISIQEETVPVSVRGRALSTNETYEVRVDPTSNIITIRAAQPAGAFYAIQTLFSLIDQQGNIPETVVRDGPRYRYRGVMLDVARSFHPKESIYRYIDLMAMYKLNKLHFHLTDDEGWRLAIPGLEELTDVGATRCHDPSESTCLLPFLGVGPYPGPPGSGFYTVEDYRDILRYALARHVEVIPEIEMPGHAHAAVKAMESRYRRLASSNISEASRFLLSDLQDQSEYMSVQGFTDNALNPCLRSTYTFINRVLNSLFAMHRDISPLRVFNFGGDEVAAGAWEKSPVCSRLRQSGVTQQLKLYLATQIANMTSIYNLDLAAWQDGIMDDEGPMKRTTLPNKNVYAYAWNNVWEWGEARRAYDFANRGYKVIVVPATNLYLDHPYEPDPVESGLYWASRFTTTKKVFETMPENLYWNADTYRSGKKITICENITDCPALQHPENIEGIQAALFGELIRSQDLMDYMMLPRLLAMAERAWHAADWEYMEDPAQRQSALDSDWTNFANTVGYRELERLDRLGYKYRVPPPGARVKDGVMETSLAFPGLRVELSKDGGETWEVVSDQGVAVESQGDYLLRTRSAFGTRYSREVSLYPASEDDDDDADKDTGSLPGLSKLLTALAALLTCLQLNYIILL